MCFTGLLRGTEELILNTVLARGKHSVISASLVSLLAADSLCEAMGWVFQKGRMLLGLELFYSQGLEEQVLRS